MQIIQNLLKVALIGIDADELLRYAVLENSPIYLATELDEMGQ